MSKKKVSRSEPFLGDVPKPWFIHFHRNNQVFITDCSIVIDQRVAFVDPLPPAASETQYAVFDECMKRPAGPMFQLADLTARENGNYDGPEGLILGRPYIEFLRRRVPEDLLRFVMTGDATKPVHLFRESEHIGALMPMSFPDEICARKLKKAAEAGDADAQVKLGYFYEFGSERVSVDFSKALYWFRRAAKQNHPAAFFHLGMMFYMGMGVEGNYLKSLLLIEKAIELDNKEALLWRSRIIQGMAPEEYSVIASQIACSMMQAKRT